ncbi:MAG: hypothetical protein HY084_10985 [Gemmatimonadetes bacterium]|nr:hypothetical protein [Gemmatimonadota bacterium]
MAFTRRTFIKAGAIGASALVAAGAYETWRLRRCAAGDQGALSPAGRALFAAVLPAFLDGVVLPSAWTPALMATALDGVERTVAALSPAARAELHQLFCLLDQRAVRFALTGVWSEWRSVDVATAKRFLERWRFGRQAMLTSAYQGLHDICYGSWYANPSSWPMTGYPGPPNILGSAA